MDHFHCRCGKGAALCQIDGVFIKFLFEHDLRGVVMKLRNGRIESCQIK